MLTRSLFIANPSTKIWRSALLATTIALLSGCGVERQSASADQPLTVSTAAELLAVTQQYRDLNNNGKVDDYENLSLPLSERVADVIARLTLEQKVKLVMGTGMNLQDYTNPDSKVPGAAGYTYPLNELGIASIVLADGPAGLRISPTRKNTQATFYATAFPVGTVLASTWDKSIVETVGQAMGDEVKEYGVDILLAPGMNIHRNPLGGRNFEYYSEDPYLSGKTAASMVNGIESKGVGATIKHFAANNQETNRFLVDTIVSERALREIYLRGFEIAVKDSQPWAVMSSYNKVNGTYTPQSAALLSRVLRDEWDFQGLVMTDWFAGDDAVAQMNAGNDLIMPGTEKDAQTITAGLTNGSLSEATLNRNLQRIIAAILTSPSVDHYAYSNQPDLLAHAQTARAAAAEGTVLLKNDKSTLPLASAIKKVAVFGNTSYDFISGGAGSGDVNEAYTVSLVQGLEASGYLIDPQLINSYQNYILTERAKQPKRANLFDLLPPLEEMSLSAEQLNALAAASDVALLTLGRNSGEFKDRSVAGDFDLTAGEQDLIARVSKAFRQQGKKLVVILNVGNVVEVASWRQHADAILLPWQGGQEAGNAIADVLTGRVNPSAKLPTSFPLRYADVPSAKNFPGIETSDELIEGIGGFAKGKPSRVDYQEGIYVGYRYYDSFNVAPAYEFGYGLSYSDFSYSSFDSSIATFDGKHQLSLTVTNVGKVPGKEVVQLYLSAPADKLKKPKQELKGFAKTRLLAPGETQTLRFELSPAELASFDEDSAAWIAEAGIYRVSFGASSRDIRSTSLFKLEREILVEKSHTAL